MGGGIVMHCETDSFFGPVTSGPISIIYGRENPHSSVASAIIHTSTLSQYKIESEDTL